MCIQKERKSILRGGAGALRVRVRIAVKHVGNTKGVIRSIIILPEIVDCRF
jgi:hypothetical protein